VLGKRLGRTKWPYSNKTVFGTASFVVSIFCAAMLLRVSGIVEPFSVSRPQLASMLAVYLNLSFCQIPRYLLATTMAGLLEAVSAQNDNLIIPIFFWSLLSLLEV
jgi:dolichol kinase